MLIEKEIKNIYLWEYNAFTPINYSYDFRSKSLSQVKTDWWTFTNWESYVTLDSNWIMSHSWTSTWVNNPHFYVPVSWLQDALNGWNILTIEIQFYGTTSAWWPTNLWWICSALSWRDFTDLQSIHFSLMTSSWYTNWWELAVRDWTTGTSVCKYTSSVSSWTYKFKATINLSTWAATLQRNSETALTWTVSAANLTAIKRCNKVTGRVWHDVWDLYIQTIQVNVS